MHTVPFETLVIPRKDLAQGILGQYRVYKDTENFIMVEAHNAVEALKNSGAPVAYKIERNSLSSNKVLDVNALSQPAPAASAEAAKPAEGAAQAAPATEAPAAAEAAATAVAEPAKN